LRGFDALFRALQCRDGVAHFEGHALLRRVERRRRLTAQRTSDDDILFRGRVADRDHHRHAERRIGKLVLADREQRLPEAATDVVADDDRTERRERIGIARAGQTAAAVRGHEIDLRPHAIERGIDLHVLTIETAGQLLQLGTVLLGPRDGGGHVNALVRRTRRFRQHQRLIPDRIARVACHQIAQRVLRAREVLARHHHIAASPLHLGGGLRQIRLRLRPRFDAHLRVLALLLGDAHR
jgi:hypothetical protein